MKRGPILHPELCKAIATMGHGDLFIVSDAGFPIPKDVWRIDLAIAPNLPDLYSVLDLVFAELIVERVVYASEIVTNNRPLLQWLERSLEGRGADFEPVPHARMLSDVAASARVVVRTGAFNPWGNIGLVCGTDPDAWFALPGTVMPEAYVARKARMHPSRS